MVHLDTNFLVSALQMGTTEASKLDCWFLANETVGISAVAWAELFCGPLSARDELIARQMFQHITELLQSDAEMAAKLFNQTGRRSRSLPDCMIAAIAMRSGAKLATFNTQDFQPFVQHGLVLA